MNVEKPYPYDTNSDPEKRPYQTSHHHVRAREKRIQESLMEKQDRALYQPMCDFFLFVFLT